MKKSSRAASAVLAALLGGLLLLSTAPASAEPAPGCPAAVPPGRPPGTPPNAANNPANPPAGQYPPGRCSLAFSRTFAERGGTTAFSAGGFAPGEVVSLSFGGRNLQSVTAAADGTISGSITVPNDAVLGTNEVRASAASQVLSADFRVVASAAAAPAGTGSGSLPRTGTELAGLGAAGVLLIGLGTAAVVTTRRRKVTTA